MLFSFCWTQWVPSCTAQLSFHSQLCFCPLFIPFLPLREVPEAVFNRNDFLSNLLSNGSLRQSSWTFHSMKIHCVSCHQWEAAMHVLNTKSTLFAVWQPLRNKLGCVCCPDVDGRYLQMSTGIWRISSIVSYIDAAESSSLIWWYGILRLRGNCHEHESEMNIIFHLSSGELVCWDWMRSCTTKLSTCCEEEALERSAFPPQHQQRMSQCSIIWWRRSHVGRGDQPTVWFIPGTKLMWSIATLTSSVWF